MGMEWAQSSRGRKVSGEGRKRLESRAGSGQLGMIRPEDRDPPKYGSCSRPGHRSPFAQQAADQSALGDSTRHSAVSDDDCGGARCRYPHHPGPGERRSRHAGLDPAPGLRTMAVGELLPGRAAAGGTLSKNDDLREGEVAPESIPERALMVSPELSTELPLPGSRRAHRPGAMCCGQAAAASRQQHRQGRWQLGQHARRIDAVPSPKAVLPPCWIGIRAAMLATM